MFQTTLLQPRLGMNREVTGSQLILADGPLAFWDCQETAGTTLADSAGLSPTNTITVSGTGYTVGASGRSAERPYCVNLTSASYLDVAKDVPFQVVGDMTILLWWKAPSGWTTGSNLKIANCITAGETQATNEAYAFELHGVSGASNDAFEYLHEYGSGTNVTFTTSMGIDIAASTWYHLAMTRDATAKRVVLYVNAVQRVSQTYATNPDGGTSSVFQINRNNADGTLGIGGGIQEYAFFNKVLSARRIAAIYAAG